MHIHRKFWFNFFLENTPFLNLEIWPNERYYSKQFVSSTPLKPFNEISWNFVVVKDLMCRYAYPQEIMIQIFSGSNAPFWTWRFDQNERYYWNSTTETVCQFLWHRWHRSKEWYFSKHFVSATPLKPLNRIPWNFVVMKDIMCRSAYPQEILIQFFLSELRPFWT